MRIRQYGNGNTRITLEPNELIFQQVSKSKPWDKDIKIAERKARWLL